MKQDFNLISTAKQVLIQEIAALKKLDTVIENDLAALVDIILSLKGKLIFSGMGKSGYIAKKISATFSSIGVASFFLHPAESSHGDIGGVSDNDVVVLLSNSGNTQELHTILVHCQTNNIMTIGVTREKESMLYNMAKKCVVLPCVAEASEINMPTTSIIMTLAFWDAVAVVVQKASGFGKKEFKKLHPGGAIGTQLMPINKLMHTKDRLPKILSSAQGKEIIIEMTKKKFGCVAVMNELDELVGVITDGDLRRNLDLDLHKIIAKEIMHTRPVTACHDALASDVLHEMNNKKVMQIFITEGAKLIGIVHMHDLVEAS
jgi:arabinose-5-phosphate isomerase